MAKYEMYDPIIMNTVHTVIDGFKDTIHKTGGRLQQDPFIAEGTPSTAKWDYKIFHGRGWFVFQLPTGARNPIRRAFNAAKKLTGMNIHEKAKFKRESTGFIGDYKSLTDRPEILEAVRQDHVLTAYLTSEFEANRGIGMLSVEVTYVPRRRNPGRTAPLLDNPKRKVRRRKRTKKQTRKKVTQAAASSYMIKGASHDMGAKPVLIRRKTKKEATRAAKLMKETGYKTIRIVKVPRQKKTRKKRAGPRKRKTVRRVPALEYRKGTFRKSTDGRTLPPSVRKRTLKSEVLHKAIKTNSPNKGAQYAVWVSKKTGKVTGVQKLNRKVGTKKAVKKVRRKKTRRKR